MKPGRKTIEDNTNYIEILIKSSINYEDIDENEAQEFRIKEAEINDIVDKNKG